MSESKLTLFFRRGIEMELILEWGSKLTCFSCRSIKTWVQCLDRNWLGFCVGVKKYLVLVSGLKFTCFVCQGIEVDLILYGGPNLISFLVRGSKLICFLCGGWKSTLRVWSWLVFSAVIDSIGFYVGGRNWLSFGMRAANHSVLLWALKLTWFLCGWSKLTWFE